MSESLDSRSRTTQSISMSVGRRAFEGASWLAFFKLGSQLFSWTVTILVARMLVPGDYGLIAMATIITGYALRFSELGLGAAIIQRPKTNHNELSSVFWFALCPSMILALSCYGLAYITALIFNEPRVIPITKVVGILFIIQGLQIVPMNLLKKNLDFKKIGLIEITAVIISCTSMLVIATRGGGVWTLIGGSIILGSTKLAVIYYITRWLPSLHFDFQEAKPYLRFGILVLLQGTLFYLSEKSDKLFAGRAWPANTLGYYSFALQLAQIPTEKITVLINQVAFSALSLLQNDQQKFNSLYLNIMKITATLVMPLFVGGYLIGENLIQVLLDEKWLPITTIFKYLCLVQIIVSINALNDFVHNAQGRPHWSLWNNVARALLMPISFFFAVKYGLNAILAPWFTTYIFISTVWCIVTLNKIGIELLAYIRNLMNPIMATLVMTTAIQLFHYEVFLQFFEKNSLIAALLIKIAIGVLFYISYLWLFDRKLFYGIRDLRKT